MAKQYNLTTEQLKTLQAGSKNLSKEQQATLGNALKSGQITNADRPTQTSTNQTTTPNAVTTPTGGKSGEQFDIENYNTTNAGSPENMTGQGQIDNTGTTPGGVVLGVKEQETPTQTVLEEKIKNGTSTAKENYEYNQMVQDNEGARKLMQGNTQTSTITQNNQSLPQNIEEWKANGGDKNTLIDMIDSRYNTNAIENADGTIQATIGNDIVKWTFDETGNPIKQVVARVGEDTTEGMYNKIMAGQQVDKNNKNYPNAQALADYVTPYISMTETQLYDNFIAGKIPASLEKLIASNPNLAKAKEKYNNYLGVENINYSNEIAYNGYKGNTRLDDLEDQLNKINNMMIDFMENSGKDENEIISYRDYMQSAYPELEQENAEYQAKIKEKRQLEDIIYNSIEDLKKQYPGASINELISLSNRLNRDNNNRIRTLGYDISELSGDIQFKMNLADKEYDYIFQQQARQDKLDTEKRNMQYNYIQNLQQRAYDLYDTVEKREYDQGLLAEQRAYEQQLTAEERAYNEAKTIKNLELNYQYTYGDLNSTNPQLQDTAIRNAIASLYTAYPIPGMESQEAKYSRVKSMIAEGMTPEQALAEVENQIRNSDGYKALKQSGNNSADLQWVGLGVYDDYGNELKGRFNKTTGEVIPYSGGNGEEGYNSSGNYGNGITGGLGSGIDLSQMSDLIAQYPDEASIKNNNPTGLTWGISNELKQMLIDAGIEFGEGGKRPTLEGGNYIKFKNIEDGLLAYEISLTQRGEDVYGRLYDWTAGGDDKTPEAIKKANKKAYAQSLMSQAGIPIGTKFSDLNDEQLGALMDAQIRRESPGLYDVLTSLSEQETTQTQSNYNPNKATQYTNYIEKGTIPAGLKNGTKAYDNFISEANEYIKENPNKTGMPEGFDLVNPELYSQLSAKDKTDIKSSMQSYNSYINSSKKLLELVDKYGNEFYPSKEKKQMQQLVRDLQLQAKELYNLGVLNGPDLELMEQIIYNPTSFGANFRFNSTIKDLIEESEDIVLDKGRQRLALYGIVPISQINTNTVNTNLGTYQVNGKNFSSYSDMGNYYFTPAKPTTQELENTYFNN